jgi:hypothetical protein
MIVDLTERVRALSLLSGGLDSQLAVCVLRDQGIEVHGVVFESPFFDSAPARKAAEQLRIPLHIVDFSADIVGILKAPKHGFGNCLNPCIDCHARMLNRAGAMAEEEGFDFLSTGEVLDERPMSQNRRSLDIVARESGYPDLIVRPLSATRLPETVPEQSGKVDRSRLLGLHGRGRKPQFELAERFGLKEYPSPAGGCRLTEPNFCKRLDDLRRHEGLDGTRSITMLRYGRHFRINERLKLVVGRNEQDNIMLEGSAELYDLVLKPEGVPGPTALLPFTATDDEVRLGAEICARYSDVPSDAAVSIRVRSSRGLVRLEVSPAKPERIEALRI